MLSAAHAILCKAVLPIPSLKVHTMNFVKYTIRYSLLIVNNYFIAASTPVAYLNKKAPA